MALGTKRIKASFATSRVRSSDRDPFEQAHTLIDNAGVIQVFCPRNLHMAQDFASVIGEISADQVIGMSADQPLLRIEEEVRPPQPVRYYNDEFFQASTRKAI